MIMTCYLYSFICCISVLFPVCVGKFAFLHVEEIEAVVLLGDQ
jgi:hypothetical protein